MWRWWFGKNIQLTQERRDDNKVAYIVQIIRRVLHSRCFGISQLQNVYQLEWLHLDEPAPGMGHAGLLLVLEHLIELN